MATAFRSASPYYRWRSSLYGAVQQLLERMRNPVVLLAAGVLSWLVSMVIMESVAKELLESAGYFAGAIVVWGICRDLRLLPEAAMLIALGIICAQHFG